MQWKVLGVLLGAVLSLAGSAAWGENTLVAGFGVGNGSCGTGVPTAFVEYERREAMSPVRLHLRTAPDGACSGQATAVDASIAWRVPVGDSWGMSVGAGYDQRVIPFEYGCAADDCRALPGKLFRGVEVATPSALLGVWYDGGGWTVEARYDAVESDYAAGGGVPPISVAYQHTLGPVTVEATLLPSWILDATATLDLGDRLRLAGRVAHNAALLEHPAPPWVEAADGSRWPRLGGPRTVYAVDVGVRF